MYNVNDSYDSLTAVPPCNINEITKCAAQCLPNQKDIETPSRHWFIHLGRIHLCNGNMIEVSDGIFFELRFNLQVHIKYMRDLSSLGI